MRMLKFTVPVLLMFIVLPLFSQDIKSAFRYYQAKNYEQAVLEFDKVLPDLKTKYGANDTVKYSKILLLAAKSNAKSGNTPKAKAYYRECRAIYKQNNILDNHVYASCCSQLASLYFADNELDSAEYCFLESKNVRANVFGKSHLKYALSCYNLAFFYEETKQYEKADSLYLEALKIYQNKNLISKSFRIVNQSAALYAKTNETGKTITLYLNYKKYLEKNHQNQSLIYIETCRKLAELYHISGDKDKAENLYLKSANLYKKTGGDTSVNYAQVLNNLAVLYFDRALYDKAEPLFLEAEQIYAIRKEKFYTEYALLCYDLGKLYYLTGNYEKSEQYHTEALEIRKQIFGTKHEDYAASCNGLGMLYSATGNYEKAETYYKDAVQIRKQLFGTKNLKYAQTCNNLASLYYVQKKYLSAVSLYLDVKSFYEDKYGKESLGYATVCNNLGLVYRDMQNYLKAESLFSEALKIRKKQLGDKHPDYAVVCNNLALVYKEQAEYEKAEALFLESLKIIEQVFGNKHIKYALACTNLADNYVLKGQNIKAESYYLKANTVIRFLVSESTKFMSESERERYLNHEINDYFDTFYSFFLINTKDKNKFNGFVLNNSLLMKSQLLRSTVALRKAVLQTNDTALISSYAQMINYGKILAKQYALPIADRRADLNELEEKRNHLEKELAGKVAKRDIMSQQISAPADWKKIKSSLKKDESALEFVKFNYNDATHFTDSVFYYAVLLRKNYKQPESVFLFEEKQLRQLIYQSSDVSDFEHIKALYAPGAPKADSLSALIWKPLEPYLKDIKTVYLSPVGLLNTIAFDALPADSLNLISDTYKIVYQTTLANLLNRKPLYKRSLKKIVLFGGIKYDVDIHKMLLNASKFHHTELVSPVSGSSVLASKKTGATLSWNYLPGTLDEVNKISKMADNEGVISFVYKGEQGSEEQFKSLEKDAPSVLHISTHGFYFGDDAKSRKIKTYLRKDVNFVFSDNPLLRSGLILAGGTAAFNGQKIPAKIEDGVLTASEISQLNLFKTELAVLSACQTGLGDVKGSEGVYGLQRAFKMAGADYLIYALWEVPDKQTQELMSHFYENWFSGAEIHDAFKEAQNQLKAKYAGIEGAAFAWAAFVLIR